MSTQTNLKEVVRSHFTTGDAVNKWETVYQEENDFFAYAMSARRSAVFEIFLHDNPLTSPLVADIGCGSGLISKDLINIGYDVTGLDISEGMLENARKIPDLKLRVGDVEHLPFADASFDRVVCLGVITYLPDERKALGELYRILKPGGRLVLAVRNKLEIAVISDVLGVIAKIFRKIVPKPTDPSKPPFYHRNFFSWPLDRNLVRTGFSLSLRQGRGYDFPQVLGRRIFPVKAGIRFSRLMENLSDTRLFSFLRNFGLVYIVVARKQG